MTPNDLKDLPAHRYMEEMWLPEWRTRRQKQIDNAVSHYQTRSHNSAQPAAKTLSANACGCLLASV